MHTGGGVDFDWTSSPAILTLVFDSTNLLTPQCFDIAINDDQEVEPEEVFFVSLIELRNNPRGRASLQFAAAVVSIADNDGKLVRYVVLEGCAETAIKSQVTPCAQIRSSCKLL